MKFANNSVSIKAVGDICPGNEAMDGCGILSKCKKYGCDYPLNHALDFLSGSDLLIGNLEGGLSSKCVAKDLRMFGLPEFASVLRKNVGFDILSVANNHVLDQGPAHFYETVSHLKEAGIQVCGLRGNNDFFSEPVIIEKNELRIGVLAYNWVGLEAVPNSDKYIAAIEDSVVNYSWHRDPQQNLANREAIGKKNKNVLSDIRKLNSKVDFLILLPHWGYEWTIFPPYGVTLEAHTFIDAGVDLIIGSHPHIAQGIEVYKEKVISYSLGNFLFDPQPEKSSLGMVFDCTIEKKRINTYNFFAVSCDHTCQPRYASEPLQNNLIDEVEKSSQKMTSERVSSLLDDELIYKIFEKNYNRRKLKKIKYLFFTLLKNPQVAGHVLQKINTLIKIIVLRLQGKKVRW